MPLPLTSGTLNSSIPYHTPAPNRRGIKQCFCLMSVMYIGPKSRTERPRKTKIGTEVGHVTRDSDTTFRVKGQGHQAALVGCSSHYIEYINETSLYATAQSNLLPVNHKYSWSKAHWAPQA